MVYPEHSVLFFGKLPCRGDFVRSATAPALIQSLDRWLSSGVELMADDAHWKQMYDQAPGARFVMLGAQRSTAVVGYLLPSADAAGRRFPFVVATPLEAGPGLMGLCALTLPPVWSQLAALANSSFKSGAASETVLSNLNSAQGAAPGSMAQAHEEHRRYLEKTTLAEVTQAFQDANASVDFRQALLALGLLLRPLLGSGAKSIEKGLQLPLPANEPSRSRMAAFWMTLVAEFVARTPHDLSLFMPDEAGPQARLFIGFSAGSAPVLHGLLDARVSASVFVELTSSAWVEDYLSNDYGLKKLSGYLQLPQMSLAQISDSFREAFLGI